MVNFDYYNWLWRQLLKNICSCQLHPRYCFGSIVFPHKYWVTITRPGCHLIKNLKEYTSIDLFFFIFNKSRIENIRFRILGLIHRVIITQNKHKAEKSEYLFSGYRFVCNQYHKRRFYSIFLRFEVVQHLPTKGDWWQNKIKTFRIKFEFDFSHKKTCLQKYVNLTLGCWCFSIWYAPPTL